MTPGREHDPFVPSPAIGKAARHAAFCLFCDVESAVTGGVPATPEPGTWSAPVITVTATDRPVDECWAREAGAHACLAKPIDTRSLAPQARRTEPA